MRPLLLLILTLIATPIAAQYHPDILGEGYEQRTILMGEDHSGEIVTTLVRRTPLIDSERAILYIHGYNDYHFQREMGDRFHDSLYNFYAVDLRRYGRSLRAEQSPCEIRQIEEYFADIDSALVSMRRDGISRVTIMGHSTGGLTASLYCDARRNDSMIEGLILNSPFFDMNQSWVVERFVIPLAAWIGGAFPDLVISHDSTTSYSESLLKEYHGEWEYNTSWKKFDGRPTTAGWLRAIHTAQMQLQEGLDIEIPILVIHSDRSLICPVWSEECQTSDIVLDVEDIVRLSRVIGDQVTRVEIVNGMHDILLSRGDVRDAAYKVIFRHLSQY